jgi:hypothetical protein
MTLPMGMTTLTARHRRWLIALACLCPAAGAAQQMTVRTPEASYRAPGTVSGAGPNGATRQCRDGTYLPAPSADTACDRHGGVLARFPLLRQPAPTSTAALQATVAPVAVVEPELRIPVPATPSRATSLVKVPMRPTDATALCRDGTYVRADTAVTTRCLDHGGLQLRFAPRPRR